MRCDNIEVNQEELQINFNAYDALPKVSAFLTGMHRKNGEDLILAVDRVEKDGVLIKTRGESSVGLCIVVGPESLLSTD